MTPTKSRINGVDVLFVVADPRADEVRAVYRRGATVKEIAQAEGAGIAVNFNFADTTAGQPIGRMIVDGKVVVPDIPKTAPRDELYMLPDRSIHIGKAPETAVWAVQGSPPLLRGGRNVVHEGISRDQTGSDIWQRRAIRTAAGITADGRLVLVRTLGEVYLSELAEIMERLGCVDALNGDGGGSSYMWPADTGWGRKLGSAIIVKKGDGKKVFKVAIDDGHGMETPGKRTPPFPDGTVMRENEFNRRVAELLAEHLMRCGFEIVLVAPGDTDVPRSVRAQRANDAKADLFISIHANAYGTDWNDARGIETFHFPGSVQGERAARIIHRHMLAGTKLPDRGVKTAKFDVLEKTKMPAVLVECGFMTNLEEAKLLLSEAYRAECAEELARGVCEYFGVEYVPPSKAEPAPRPADNMPKVDGEVRVVVNDRDIGTGYIIGGRTYVPLRAIGEALGLQVGWDQSTKTASLKGGK